MRLVSLWVLLIVVVLGVRVFLLVLPPELDVERGVMQVQVQQSRAHLAALKQRPAAQLHTTAAERNARGNPCHR